MRTLVARDLMLAWEWGKGRHPLDCALVLLAVAYPEQDRQTLARLTIGQRDALLLVLREQLFGEALEVQVTCKGCEEAYQFDVKVRDVLIREPSLVPDDRLFQVDLGETSVTFRAPNSLDLAAVAGLSDRDAARRALLQRCTGAALEGLEARHLSRLSAALTAADPQAEIVFPFQCDVCQQQWKAELDIGSYLWAEVSGWVRRTMHEVAQLARAFGWSEADILTMGDERRHAYLKLCGP